MGRADLTGSRAELKRADEHLQAVYSEMRKYIERDPEAGRVQLWYETPWYVVRMKPLPPFPLQTALLLGDCIRDICAALDHLIRQLILREDQEPQEHFGFPICETEEDFINKVELPTQRGDQRSPLYGIPVNGDAWAIIKRAQPFLSVKPHMQPLFQVARLNSILNDVDKNRALLMQHALIDVQEVLSHLHWIPDLQPIEQQITAPFLRMETPAELARFQFAGNISMSMYVDDYASAEPMVGDGESYVSVGILKIAILFVEQILNQVATLPRVQG